MILGMVLFKPPEIHVTAYYPKGAGETGTSKTLFGQYAALQPSTFQKYGKTFSGAGKRHHDVERILGASMEDDDKIF